METTVSMPLSGSREEIWSLVTDIEAAKDRISCILDLTILERPSSGLVGLKWRETREMFGRQAEETMWIIEAETERFYITEARNSGCIYHSTVQLGEESADGTMVTMSFKASPQTWLARLMSPMMLAMKGMIKKAFLKDLEDLDLYLRNTKNLSTEN